MRKKKEKYSLTANQRKEQRQAEEQKGQPKKSFEELSEDEQTALLAEREEKRQKSKKLNRLIAIVLATVLALGAIATGITLLALNNKIDNDKTDPVATITLSNNQKLEIKLFYTDKAMRATVANFIYLAKNGFYDDTIFLANEGRSYLLMAGLDTPIRQKAQTTSYIQGLKGFVFRLDDYNFGTSTNFRLGYRLNQVVQKPANETGYVAFMAGTNSTFGTSTSFLLLSKNNDNLNPLGNNPFSLTYFGKMTDKSLQNMQQILSAGYDNEVKHSATWLYSKNADIRIKSVKISKLNKKLEKNILNNFESFVLDADSTLKGALKGASSTWRNNTGGYFDTSATIN